MKTIDKMYPRLPRAAGILGFDSAMGRDYYRHPSSGEPSATVEPGEQRVITARPQRPFHGERLLVGSMCAPHFIITRAYVGCESAFLDASPVMAEAFATLGDLMPLVLRSYEENGVVCVDVRTEQRETLGGDLVLGAPLVLPVALPGIEIGLYVENISDSPRRFLACVYGTTVRD